MRLFVGTIQASPNPVANVYVGTVLIEMTTFKLQ